MQVDHSSPFDEGTNDDRFEAVTIFLPADVAFAASYCTCVDIDAEVRHGVNTAIAYVPMLLECSIELSRP